jgi:hypothetical protein
LRYGQDDIAISLLTQGATTTLVDKSKRLAADYLLGSYLNNKRSRQKQTQLSNEQTLIRCWEKVCPLNLVYDHGERQFRPGSRSMLFFLILLLRNTSDVKLSLGNTIRQFLSLASFRSKSLLETETRALEIATSIYPFLQTLRQEVAQNREISANDTFSAVCKLADKIPNFSMDTLVELTALIPDEILPPYRKKRSYINSIMAANEISKKDSPYCKEAFVRISRGIYILNPDLFF